MKIKTIRTNDRCEKCDGFLIFEVRDEYQDDCSNKTTAGVWKCTSCEMATIGIIIRSLGIKAVSRN